MAKTSIEYRVDRNSGKMWMFLSNQPECQIPVAECAGRLDLVIGSMFSNKTMETERQCDVCEVARQAWELFFPEKDTRMTPGDMKIRSRHPNSMGTTGKQIKSMIDAAVQVLDRYYSTNVLVRCVMVDEAWMLPDFPEGSLHLRRMGVDVKATMLNGNYHTLIFPVLASVIPHATSIDVKPAYCMICKGQRGQRGLHDHARQRGHDSASFREHGL